jgi:outer membrane protein TolC
MRVYAWLAAVATALYATASAQEARRLILPEQRRIEVRRPSQLRHVPLPDVPPPATVAAGNPRYEVWPLALDEAIRTSLANSEVIRMLSGTAAVASGATIYDPAIANTQIDQDRATFDPTVESNNTFFRNERPVDSLDSPFRLRAAPTEGFRSSTGVQKQFITGGTARVGVNVDHSRIEGRPLSPVLLNPRTTSDTSLSFIQPLLQGAGAEANLAPILISRIDTERSFFQMKDSVQELVRGTIEAYWQLSFAQVDVWAREQQVAQGREAFELARDRREIGIVDIADEAQARVAYETFRANLIAAEANRLAREAALRNIIGLSPSDQRRLVPATSPSTRRLSVAWSEILALAEEYRPDLIELKLVLEADEQQLVIARNNALPRLDGVALYRWNGLEGRTPAGIRISDNGEFQDWELGVNFSVPLGLRRERAQVRQSELVLARDRASLDQSLHAAAHRLAASYRDLDQYYEQYAAFSRVRDAARLNADRQLADFRTGRRTIYLNVLQAITDWGNAVSSENQALVLYNIELANLERDTGTILESHGVRFWEERFRSVGPLGRHFPSLCYPRAMSPGPNSDRPPVAAEDVYRLPEVVPLPGMDANRTEPLPAPNGHSSERAAPRSRSVQ